MNRRLKPAGPGRGGPREGAGRPSGMNRVPLNVKLPEWLVRWLKREVKTARAFNAKTSQSMMIEKALIEYYNLKEKK